MTSSVIEETMKRIQSHKGVEAILIVDNDGHVIQSNLKERSEEHAALLCQLVRSPSFARSSGSEISLTTQQQKTLTDIESTKCGKNIGQYE
jgi:predicted regulator of Ras-like GTPase activity (Roadblock/LC7/MglB family)